MARRFGAGPGRFVWRLHARDETSDAATHVESRGDVLSDGGAIPPGSTNLRSPASRRASVGKPSELTSRARRLPAIARRATVGIHFTGSRVPGSRFPRASCLHAPPAGVRVPHLLSRGDDFLHLLPATSPSGRGNAPTICAGSPARASASRCSSARSRSHDGRVTVERRRQPLRVAPDTRLTAVVRIETDHHVADLALVARVADEIADAARMPRATAAQIDFDARLSERPFYSALLREVRRRVRPPLRVSMTALASWCADDPWIEADVVRRDRADASFRWGRTPAASSPGCRSRSATLAGRGLQRSARRVDRRTLAPAAAGARPPTSRRGREVPCVCAARTRWSGRRAVAAVKGSS